jgi:holo-[acyl-carrier protein] synthase
MEKDIKKSLTDIGATQKFVIGNDLVFVPNFQLSCTDLFIKKAFTAAEIAYSEQFADPMLRYASTWAGKEAVYKALKQIDKTTLGWKKIEIIREKNAGQPHVILHKNTSPLKISLTISHDGDYVWAIALVETDIQPT